ncbi:hypothetical protein HPY18_03865 [Vibrio parahaemolyticus]|uniref:hypothetical protein n=1 Tax=Vibrio parahaemolyticus TaxID=670 RepID=UPI0011224FB7|nr:hypothetical protein [Vibrio parahaemolyticus]MBD2853560.1 hypothetical protein [Vibrio parahaemolyticus]TPA32206.1 hypothetical protein DXJ85_25075 [Vibrio parahaemolyticus]
MFIKLRNQFSLEWTWRLFIVLSIASLVLMIFFDLTSRTWSVIPDFLDYHGNLQFRWDLFDSRYWTRFIHNWLALFLFIGPWFIAKSADWVSSAKRKEKT